MKYIVDLPNAYTSESALFGDILSIPICLEGGKRYGIPTGIKLEPYTKPDREAIEDEVWKFAKKIGSFNGLSKHELDECFGHTTIQGVMTTYDTYQEAKEKYDAWKAEKEEIRVGDEVVYHGSKYVVGYVGADEVYHIVDRNWIRVVVQGDYQIFKTGRHFDEVEDILEKMKEGDLS